MKLLRIGLTIGLGCAALGVWAGFAGAVHPAGDSVALFRIILGVICLLGCLWQIRRFWRVTLGLTGGAALLTTLPLFVGGQPDGELTIYTKNIWFGNTAVSALARDIRESGAEVVMLQEVSNRNDAILTLLLDDFPYQHVCRYRWWNGLAVLSAHPIATTACSDRRAVAAAQIVANGQAVWLTSVHLSWPFPYDQVTSVVDAKTVLAQLDGPVVMAGDFNIFPWATSVGRLRQASGTIAARPIRPTLHLRGVPLLLDHVYAPGGGRVSYRPLLGSDHRGVLATVVLNK